jgi:hypothetical protein
VAIITPYLAISSVRRSRSLYNMPQLPQLPQLAPISSIDRDHSRGRSRKPSSQPKHNLQSLRTQLPSIPITPRPQTDLSYCTMVTASSEPSVATLPCEPLCVNCNLPTADPLLTTCMHVFCSTCLDDSDVCFCPRDLWPINKDEAEVLSASDSCDPATSTKLSDIVLSPLPTSINMTRGSKNALLRPLDGGRTSGVLNKEASTRECKKLPLLRKGYVSY